MSKQTTSSGSKRMRVRDVLPDLKIGFYTPGPKNSITDVPGVLAHTRTINLPANHPKHDIVNTGITTILPRKSWLTTGCYGSFFTFNGSGECTGTHWLGETGILNSPILITNSWAVGECYQGVYRYIAKVNREEAEQAATKEGKTRDKAILCDMFALPVIAETYDGRLNDVTAFPINPDMIIEGIEAASSDPVPEGNRGGGTAMGLLGHKGGTGSASRVVKATLTARDGSEEEREYTVAALLQCNFGAKRDLRIGGVPVGRILVDEDDEKTSQAKAEEKSSVIVVLATDAPLTPSQLHRLAKRATVGIARVGGWGSNYSGDVFLAFSTGADVPFEQKAFKTANVVDTSVDGYGFVKEATMNPLFESAADTVEESVYNALCMAEDMKGPAGRHMEAIDLDRLKKIMSKYL